MTSQQKQAIEKTEGACVILAGAGTGKSFTLKKKANYLVNEKQLYKPSEILCLTFSNEATNDLKKGLQEELKTTEDVEVKTFHAFCGDVLREDGHLIGVDEGFEILLPDDAKIFMHKYLGISPYWSNRYINTIHTAKDFGISLDQIKEFSDKIDLPKENLDEIAKKKKIVLQTLYLQSNFTKEEKSNNKETKKEAQEFLKKYDKKKRFDNFIDAWEKFDQLKKEKNYLDFSDLNYYTLELFRKFGSAKYSEQYKYVFVDEFQDTNKLQFELIEYIAPHHNITVVGDENQSIYGFRGSYKESFKHFMEVFEAEKEFHLDKSYRSPNSVLKVAYDLIKNNHEKPEDCFFVENAKGIDGDSVKVIQTINRYEEARYIANLVDEKIKAGVPKEEICILHRTHQQAEAIKEALNLKGTPFISAGKIDLLQKREIRTAIGYLSIVANLIERSGTGEQAWWDLFHFQNTLSPADSVKIGRYLKKNNGHDVPLENQLGIDDLLLNSLDSLDLSENGRKIVLRVANKLKEVVSVSNKPLPELILDIYEISGLNRAFSHSRTIGNIESLMNLRKFYDIAKNYYELHEKSIPEFIKYLEMVDSLGVNIDASKVLHVDAVRLMTIHAAKGLEFDLVIVCNMAKDRFPVGRTRNEPLIPKELLPDFKAQISEWEKQGLSEKEITQNIKDYDKKIQLFEERRLCYVAWTRTKKELVITYALSYNDEPNSTSKSEFLQEIEDYEFIEDNDELSSIISPNSSYEEYKSMLKNQLIGALDTDDFETLKERLAVYLTCRDKQIIGNYPDLERHLAKCVEEKSSITFDSKSFTFSPTALIEYSECPKKFELSKIYQMPQRGEFDGEGGSTLGSFVHKVLEEGVKSGLNSCDEFKKLALEMSSDKEWEGVDISDVNPLLDVFWYRNSSKLGNSEVELKLIFEISGFKFIGLADRIDHLPDGSVEIVDYKTNKNSISPSKRALQLGFYALALISKGYKVSRLTLDMLKLDKPVSMVVDGDDVLNDVGGNKSSNFKLSELKEKILELCNKIKHDYEHSFDCTTDDSPCRFCGYKFYCPKWGE
ncbi:MAG: ATP-dependent helicase [Nanobdellota archaeon]